MPVFSHFPLQKAVYLALSGDTSLMAKVTGVYDRPPQNTAYPYVVIGDSLIQDWSTKTTAGTEHSFTVHVWSREGGRKQAVGIMERIHTLLHQASLPVEDHVLVMMRFSSSNIVLENDGWTYHGTLRFQALLETTS